MTRDEGGSRSGPWLRFAAGLLVSAVLLWWVFHDVSLADVWRLTRGADPVLLAAMTAVSTLGFVLRALRWRVLLLPTHPEVSFSGRWAAVCIGFMVNNLLPARMGEFARAYSVSRSEPVGMSAAFASLVVERALDGLVIALFLTLAATVPGPVAAEAGDGPVVRQLAFGGAAIFGLALVGLWWAARSPRRVREISRKTLGRLLPGRLGRRATDVVSRFCEGLGALRDPGLFLRALSWSLVIWLWLAVSVWLGLLAFGIRRPGFAGALLVQSVVAFAVALPSSPAFVGPFEAGARVALAIFGVDEASIVSFAVVAHVLTFLPVTLLGLWYLNRLGLRWREIGESPEHVRAASRTGPEGDSTHWRGK